MPQINADREPQASPVRSRWYQQPILWVGVAIFVASMAGCIWIIVVSSRYADPPLPTHTPSVMGVPAAGRSVSGPSR